MFFGVAQTIKPIFFNLDILNLDTMTMIYNNLRGLRRLNQSFEPGVFFFQDQDFFSLSELRCFFNLPPVQLNFSGGVVVVSLHTVRPWKVGVGRRSAIRFRNRSIFQGSCYISLEV